MISENPGYQSGFSLAESLISLAIIGVLLILAIAQFASIQAHHRDNDRKKDITALQQKVAEYYALQGRYPVKLTDIKGLSDDICRMPRGSGSCNNPDYSYKAFRPGTQVLTSTTANCNNLLAMSECKNYIIYTDSMETIGNPYWVQNY